MKILYYQQCESTNSLALELGKQGAEHGTVVVAGSQTAGRGRLGRKWQSPSGKGLYCSCILRPSLASQDYPLLTFAAGLAVAGTIETICNVRPGLKWPNDIYFGMGKCGGILNEASGLWEDDNHRFAVIGIGLNINTVTEDFPLALRGRATSLAIETGHQVDIKHFLATLHANLMKEVDCLVAQGFALLLRRWERYDCLKGRALTWVTVAGEQVHGVSLGVDQNGYLHVTDEAGAVHQVLSGDIELGTG